MTFFKTTVGAGRCVTRFINKTALVAVTGAIPLALFSQEIQFSQYQAFPLYLNPALTGEIPQQRIALASRRQWTGIAGAYSTRGFSYDHKLDDWKSGIGLMVLQDETSGGGMATFTAGGLYSYHLQINKTLYFNSGVHVSYVQQKLDPGVLTFTDQLIRNDGSATYEVFNDLVHGYMDYGWGGIFFFSNPSQAKTFHIGLALNHLSKPHASYNGSDGVIPVKSAVHGGGQFRFDRNEQGFPENVISYSFLFKSQLKWDQAELGVSYIRRLPHKRRTLVEWKKSQPKFEPSYKQFKGYTASSEMPMPLVYVEAGLAYRGIPLFKRYQPGYPNHESIIGLIGLSYYEVKLAYSFDFTISMLGYSNTAGAHEISIMYTFLIANSDKKEKKKKAKKQADLFNGV